MLLHVKAYATARNTFPANNSIIDTVININMDTSQKPSSSEEPKCHFILLSTARSGSTLLMDMLNNHPKVKCLHEPLNRETLAEKGLTSAPRHDLLKYITQLIRETQEPVIGMKVFLEHFRDTGLCLTDIVKVMTRPKVILLYRPNILDTFVSLQIAYATDQWYTMEKPKVTAVEIDWKGFREYATIWKKYWITAVHEMKQLLGADDNVIVTYDEMVESKNKLTQKMFRFLNVWEMDYDVVHYSVKQNPTDLKSKVSNFEEICKCMATDNDLLMLDL